MADTASGAWTRALPDGLLARDQTALSDLSDLFGS
jgi:hypothetical protein